MAGGEGTRLRPVSGKCPKPMVKLLGRPLLAHALELLKKHQITQVCMTLCSDPQQIKDYFGDGRDFGMELSYMVEEEPLGTAGSVAACGEFTRGEDFLVLSGDAVCDFNLSALIAEHRRHRPAVTMALYTHPEPLQYGLVLTRPDKSVLSFIEKPGWERVVTDLVNTGIYVISPEAIRAVPETGTFDFARQLFPLLMGRGEILRGVPMSGYWCDVGNPGAYLTCAMDALAGKIRLNPKLPQIAPGIYAHKLPRGVTLEPPCYLADTAVIEPGAVIGPGAVIDQNSRIGAGAVVIGSVVDGATVGQNCLISGSVVCPGAFVPPGSRMCQGSVVAAPGSKIPPELKKPEAEEPLVRPGESAVLIPCENRAAVMRAMAESLAEFGADFSDGIRISDERGQVHIAPLSDRSAISLDFIPRAKGDAVALKRKYEGLLMEKIDGQGC